MQLMQLVQSILFYGLHYNSSKKDKTNVKMSRDLHCGGGGGGNKKKDILVQFAWPVSTETKKEDIENNSPDPTSHTLHCSKRDKNSPLIQIPRWNKEINKGTWHFSNDSIYIHTGIYTLHHEKRTNGGPTSPLYNDDDHSAILLFYFVCLIVT